MVGTEWIQTPQFCNGNRNGSDRGVVIPFQHRAGGQLSRKLIPSHLKSNSRHLPNPKIPIGGFMSTRYSLRTTWLVHMYCCTIFCFHYDNNNGARCLVGLDRVEAANAGTLQFSQDNKGGVGGPNVPKIMALQTLGCPPSPNPGILANLAQKARICNQ